MCKCWVVVYWGRLTSSPSSSTSIPSSPSPPPSGPWGITPQWRSALHVAATNGHDAVIESIANVRPEPRVWHCFLVGCGGLRALRRLQGAEQEAAEQEAERLRVGGGGDRSDGGDGSGGGGAAVGGENGDGGGDGSSASDGGGGGGGIGKEGSGGRARRSSPWSGWGNKLTPTVTPTPPSSASTPATCHTPATTAIAWASPLTAALGGVNLLPRLYGSGVLDVVLSFLRKPRYMNPLQEDGRRMTALACAEQAGQTSAASLLRDIYDQIDQSRTPQGSDLRAINELEHHRHQHHQQQQQRGGGPCTCARCNNQGGGDRGGGGGGGVQRDSRSAGCCVIQ